MSDKIIRLTELLDHKLRKEKELAYYREQLLEIQDKIVTMQKDLDLTKLIIEIIQAEKVVDIEQKVRDAIPVLGVNDNGTSRPK